MTGETFSEVCLQNTELAECCFEDCRFVNCTAIDLKVRSCRFLDCTFENCRLSNVRPNLSYLADCTFTSCMLQGIAPALWTTRQSVALPLSEIRDTTLAYCTFDGMKLVKFDFSGNALQETAFARCDLRGANFRNCRLSGTSFVSCDLQKADFRETSGYRIDLASNRLKGARFSFPEVIDLLGPLGIVID